MHPFGMNYDFSPEAPKRAGEEVMDWLAAERADTADVELPMGMDDFELTLKKWLGYVPRRFWPFVATWVAAISKNARVPVSASSLKALRGMMRRDVDESAAILWDASPATIAAWVAWYPRWVEQQISEKAEKDPWFLLHAEEHYRRKRLQQSRDDTAEKAVRRDREVGARLYRHMETHGGIVRWRPGLIAHKITKRHASKPVTSTKVAEMAAALVRLDVAQWRMRSNGRPWALQVVAHLDAPALSH